MPHHRWGDTWFEQHGNDLHKAIGECMCIWVKWGRIGTHGKEKFGTFRHHVYFYTGFWPIHELTNPGYAYYQWPKPMYKAELALGKVVQLIGIPKLIYRYQAWIYNYAIQRVCRKYPNVVDELVADSNYSELIKGTIDGRSIRNKYWRDA